MTITETTTIADIAAALPGSVRVFQRHGIDFCCGGKKSLAGTCRERGLDFTDITRAIEKSCEVPESDVRDWSREPLAALIDHIVTTYHQPLREELPRLRAMASQVARVHGAKSSRLARLDDVVAELAAELLAHMQKEEAVLFPAIGALDGGAARRTPPVTLAAPISVMEQEHDHAGQLLAELRSLTDGYAVPDWGCATVRALYRGLEELESAMHVHVHLENNVLFPRSLGLRRDGTAA